MKILNFAHFFKEKRSVLEINAELPRIEKGFPKDGNLMLSISNEKGERKAFKLSVEEVSRMVFTLENFIKKHEKEIAALGERRGYSQPDSPQKSPAPKSDPLAGVIINE